MTSTAAFAACRVAETFGYLAEDPIVLQETNNTVIWLRPHAIIAKVGKRRHSDGYLLREHAVAVALAADDAPIAPPMAGAEPRRDEETGFLVTLWHRLEHDPERDPAPTELRESLRVLHLHLARYEGALPSFLDKLSLAQSALADDRLMAALPSEGRLMLRGAFDQFLPDLQTRAFTQQALHGEPHDGNLLVTPAGLRWLDLEGACMGPLEWDMAFLSEDAVALFLLLDKELLALLRTLNSARVATWCWARWESKEMRWHAEHHLQQVRRALAT